MGKGILDNRWARQLAVALGYALMYWVVAQTFASAPWPFAASLRVTCLLVMPYRYWLALVVGEIGPLIYNNIEFVDRFGLTYAAINTIPSVAVGMPVVWWFRSRAALFPARHLVDIKKLLWCVLTLSVVWGLLYYATVSTARLPTGPYRVPEGTFFLYLSNLYLAMLVIVPWVVMIRVYPRKKEWRLPPFRVLIAGALVQDVAMATFALAALAFLHHVAIDMMKPAAMMALFLPPAWLVLKHGWGAAVLGTLSLVAMCSLLEWSWTAELGIPQAQMFVAIAMTCLHTFGARISTQLHQYEKLALDAKNRQDAVQHALVSGEHRLKHNSQALESMAGILRLDYAYMLEHFVPQTDQADFSQQALLLQRHIHRLAENTHPSAWRERGVGAALYETIGLALREADIAYWCDIPVRDLNFLSQNLQAGVYRVACEAVTRVSASPSCIGVRLAVRIGRLHGISGAVLRIESMANETHVAHAVLQAEERRRVAPKLGASMNNLDELRRLTEVFDGLLHYRSLANGIRISVLLCETSSQVRRQRKHRMPMRLWVR